MNGLSLRDRISPNHDLRGDPARVDMLVLHYTGMQNAAAALDRLCDPAARVSSHYVVEEDGAVWRLVPEFEARLSRRSVVLGWRARPEFRVDRGRDRQPRS